MRAHMEAVKAMLEPLGRDVYLVDVPEGSTLRYPYIILWSTTGRMISETLCGTQSDLDDLLGVTCVGMSPEAVWSVSSLPRGLLLDEAPNVEGRHVAELRLYDTQSVQADRDVTLPNTNRHPYFGVDLYALRSTPA